MAHVVTTPEKWKLSAALLWSGEFTFCNRKCVRFNSVPVLWREIQWQPATATDV